MGLSKDQRKELAERRKLIAGLYLRRTSKADIASQMAVDVRTVYRDLEVIEAQWLAEVKIDPVQQRAMDLAAVDDLQKAAATRLLAKPDDQGWWDRVMRAMERRAKLLGLDVPPLGLPGSTPATPLYIAPGQIDWDNLPEDLADKLLAVHAEIVALQPAPGGFVVEADEYKVRDDWEGTDDE